MQRIDRLIEKAKHLPSDYLIMTREDGTQMRIPARIFDYDSKEFGLLLDGLIELKREDDAEDDEEDGN